MERILVDRLKEGPEIYAIDAAPQELDLTDHVFEFPNRVRGEVEYKLIGRDVRGTGNLETDVVTQCVRCLDPVTVHLDVPVDETWLYRDPEAHHYEEPESDEILAEYYEGDSIDAAPALRELIMYVLPDLPRCSEDCKGLCPNCGANLNREKCKCEKVSEPVEPKSEWQSKLEQLKNLRK